MGALKINVSDISGQSWPLVLHQTLDQNSTGWGPGIKFLNASDSSGKWAGIGGIASGGYANSNDLYFYTSATARYGMGSDAFAPLADNTYNLGQSALRWKRLYATKITADSAELSGYRALTVGNGGFVALDKDEMGTTYNIDALTTNSFFEVRGTNEVTLSGIRPFEGYYGCVNFHLPVCKMQIAGSNYTGFAIRGVQKAGATLEGRDWHTLLTNNNYSNYALPLSGGAVTGTITLSHNYPFRFTNVGNNESYLAADSSGLYLAVYGSNNKGKSVHLETYDTGIYHRRSDTGTNYEILTAANYNSYSPTLTGGGASGTWGINISGNAASASYLASPLHKHGGLTGKPCYPCFARITITGTYTSRPGVIILGSRDRCLCKLQVRFAGENSTDPSTLYLYHESGDSYHGIFAVKVQAGVWDLYYTKSQDWDDITVHQYFSSDFSISFPGGYITSMPSSYVSSVPLPNKGTVSYGNSKPTHQDFAGMVYYQLI